MKTILALCILVTSLNSYSFEKTVTLDFTNLYRKTNLGLYDIKVTFNEKKTPSIGKISTYALPDDGDIYCETSVSYDVGEIIMTVTDRESGVTKTFSEKVKVGGSRRVSGDDCDTDPAQFAGTQRLYSRLTIGAYATLPETPFEDYTGIGAYFSPFNGYLILNTEASLVDGKLVIDPSELLTERSISATNKENDSVTYYVYAYKGKSTLSLGSSLVKFDN